MNVFDIIGYEIYARDKICAEDVTDFGLDWVTNIQACARDCDEKGQMFAIDEACYEVRNFGMDCRCVCFNVKRNDNNAGTCNMVDAADWDLYRFVDGMFYIL